MPQRQRPRLKQYTITCDQCGDPAVKWFPSRQAVRDKLPRFRFCSAECQRKHWEARRRATWTATPYPCKQCGREIEPLQKPGRPPLYCSTKCRTAAALERQRRDPAAAVLEAHREVVASWSRALRSGHELVRLYEQVEPVRRAYAAASLVFADDSESSDSEKDEAIWSIKNRLWHLEKPRISPDEPDRRTSDWRAWWRWWKSFASAHEKSHGLHLEWLRRAGVEERRARRVIERRAETARRRRARREETKASER